jgi:hypothetical protein
MGELRDRASNTMPRSRKRTMFFQVKGIPILSFLKE